MERIIIALIREDIKQTQFIRQLNALGLSADSHLLDLSPIIFELIGLDRSKVDRTDALIDNYFTKIYENKNEHEVYSFLLGISAINDC